MNWLTASAVVAGVIFVLKILTDMWLELQRKKHYSKTMGKVVECITAENYLFAFYKELRTEYVRGFSSERKIKFLEQLKKALDNAVDLSKATHEALESLAAQTSVAQLKYWAGTRS